MKKNLFLFLIIIFSFNSVTAQEMDLLDIDFDFLDSIFDDPVVETHVQEEPEQETPSVIQSLRRRRLDLNFSYEFQGAANPGWNVYPWEFDGNEKFSWALGAGMKSNIGINAQLSDALRVRSVINYGIPGSGLTLGEFFFDYNFNEAVYLRAGKFSQSWGISPNFGFANLLKRLPVDGPSGTSYIIKFDIPVDVGGIQLLAMTRANIAGGKIPYRNEIGFGGKYNLALRWADFNLGLYYQNKMATRGFLSIKTTLGETEVYNEWLLGVNTHTDNSVGFSFNLGFFRSFLNNRLEVNGEIFYNGEGSTNYYQTETEFYKEDVSPFLSGFNAALNVLYRYNGWGNPRFFTRFLYGDESVSLIPGMRITPFPNTEVYLALPMAFGNGHYYKTSENIKGEHRPVSLLLYVTFRGSFLASLN